MFIRLTMVCHSLLRWWWNRIGLRVQFQSTGSPLLTSHSTRRSRRHGRVSTCSSTSCACHTDSGRQRCSARHRARLTRRAAVGTVGGSCQRAYLCQCQLLHNTYNHRAMSNFHSTLTRMIFISKLPPYVVSLHASRSRSRFPPVHHTTVLLRQWCLTR